jgi:hypothetical protein
MASRPEKPGKRPYAEPKLQTYGDIREITGNVGHTGKLDGGGPKPKSQL